MLRIDSLPSNNRLSPGKRAPRQRSGSELPAMDVSALRTTQKRESGVLRSCARLPAQCTRQPDLGKVPVAHYGSLRNVHYARNFFHTEAAEVAQFDHSCLPLGDLCERLQSIVQR